MKIPTITVTIKLPNVSPDNEEHKKHVLKELLRSKGLLNNPNIEFEI